MKRKLLVLALLLSIITEAQTTKTEAYLIGTKVSFYPNECGNSIPEAIDKLTFCDEIGNLGVVDNSTGLNHRTVYQILDNRANDDEVFITAEGLSIRKTDGTYENVPNIAVPDDYITGTWQNNATIFGGLVMPDNTIIFSSNGNNVLYEYNRNTKTITDNIISAIHYPRGFAYDIDRNLAWIIAVQGTSEFLYSYSQANGLVYVGELTNFGASDIASITKATLTYKDDHLYLGSVNGLYKINVTNLNSTFYNTSTTPSLPYDNVRDLQFDTNGILWMAMTGTNDGSIIKFNINTETFDQYQLPQESNPAFNYYFNKIAIADNGMVWCTATNYSGVINLEFDVSENPIWETTPLTDLPQFGVSLVFSPNNVFYRNNKFYFTSSNSSSSVSNADEILINDSGNWSAISDNIVGNTSYLANNRFNFNLPGEEGDMWWFNYFDDVVVNRKADDQLFVFSEFENLGNTAAIDIDNKPITRLGSPSPKIRKIDLPITYELLDDINQNTAALARYKDQVWWYNNSPYELKIIKYNEVIATFTLDDSYQFVFYFDVDSSGNAWFAKNVSSDVVIKKFDSNTQITTDYPFTSIGQVRDVTAGPNGTIWVLGQLGFIFYDGKTFTTHLNSNYPELYNNKSLIVDENGVAHILQNDPSSVVKVEDAETMNLTLSETIIEGNNTIVPALGQYRPNDISFDNQGALWANASLVTLKLTDNDTAREYREEGETFELSGLVYNDINENDSFDAGEEYPNQHVALKLNGEVYSTFTDDNGIYRFYLYEDNATYEITLPTIGQYVTAANRQLLVSVGETNQNYTGNDFELKPKFVSSLYVKSSSRLGAWGFIRDNFENTYTTAIANLSPNKTFSNLEVTYVFKNEDESSTNVLPSIDQVKVYEIDPNGSTVYIENVIIDQRSNKWSINAEPNTYTQTDLGITPTITTTDSEIEVVVTIPAINPLNTYIIEIESGLYDPTQNGTKIRYGVSQMDSPDFDDGNGMPLGEPIILIPLEDRDSNVSGFPEDFSETPYINPEDVYADPPYIDPNQVYSPGPYTSTIYSSYDPNDKLVDEGVAGEINDRHIGRKWLTYTIRFENTGNFSTKDVVITDQLDDSLDPYSINIIDASHEVVSEIIKTPNDKILLKFSFNDIFLPFDDANNDGYVKFLVKANEGIAENTIVDNEANIYFDQNPPIITNVIQVRFLTIESLGIEDEVLEANLRVYPNPVNEILFVKSQFGVDTIELYSILGKKVLQTNESKINVSSLSSGTYIVKVKTEKGAVSKKLIIN